jgi:hypothetical protein
VRGAVVAFGPSTTDGIGSAPDANERYPDELARRLLKLPDGERMSVLNAGIAGNRLLADNGTCGPSALNRFVRDAVEQSGVSAVILWEGTNDVATRPGLALWHEVAGAYTAADRGRPRQRPDHHRRDPAAARGGRVLQPRRATGCARRSTSGSAGAARSTTWPTSTGSCSTRGTRGGCCPPTTAATTCIPGHAGYDAIADSVDLAALVDDGLRGQVA